MKKAHEEEGLRKLIFSDQVPDAVEAGMHLFEDPVRLVKKASSIFKLADDKLRPPPGFVGIHTVALGDWETYGMNRNGDTFPKKACAERCQTFVTHGHVFRNHDNRDPENAIGKIAAAAYNEPMGRIELVIWADEKKAQPELHKLATEGDHPFSMACKVPNDRCTVCGQIRKSAADPNQCEHIRDNLGHILKNGQAVGTHNDLPTWFDESFVRRPADRIAWSLGKVASADDGMGGLDSVKLAEASGLWVPDILEYSIPGYQDKLTILQKLARLEEHYMSNAFAIGRKGGPADRYLWELRKAASYTLPDATVDQLRRYDPDRVFAMMVHNGIVLDAPTFFKYAMGTDYGELAADMPAIMERTHGKLFSNLHKSGAYQRVCRNAYFDVDTNLLSAYGVGHDNELAQLGREKLASAAAFVGPVVAGRIIDVTIQGEDPGLMVTLGKVAAADNPAADRASEIYAAYKVSMVNSILSYHKKANADSLLALAAVQDLVR